VAGVSTSRFLLARGFTNDTKLQNFRKNSRAIPDFSNRSPESLKKIRSVAVDLFDCANIEVLFALPATTYLTDPRTVGTLGSGALLISAFVNTSTPQLNIPTFTASICWVSAPGSGQPERNDLRKCQVWHTRASHGISNTRIAWCCWSTKCRIAHRCNILRLVTSDGSIFQCSQQASNGTL